VVGEQIFGQRLVLPASRDHPRPPRCASREESSVARTATSPRQVAARTSPFKVEDELRILLSNTARSDLGRDRARRHLHRVLPTAQRLRHLVDPRRRTPSRLRVARYVER